MNSHHREIESMEYEEVRELFQEFLESMITVDTLIQAENTPAEIDQIETEIDHILDIGDNVYCQLVGSDMTVPDNYSDIPRVISEEAKETGLEESRIEAAFESVIADNDEMSACAAWTETRNRLEEERQQMAIIEGYTTVDDWS